MCKFTIRQAPVVRKLGSPIHWLMCIVKVALSLRDNRSFKSNPLGSSDGSFRTLKLRHDLVEVCWLSIIDQKPKAKWLSVVQMFNWLLWNRTKKLLTNKDINTCELPFRWAHNIAIMHWWPFSDIFLYVQVKSENIVHQSWFIHPVGFQFFFCFVHLQNYFQCGKWSKGVTQLSSTIIHYQTVGSIWLFLMIWLWNGHYD